MATIRLCPACKQPLPGDSGNGFCPVCQLRGALDPTRESNAEQLFSAGAKSETAALEQKTIQATPGPDNVPTADLARIGYFGDYELEEEIARGGMGTIFKARQLTLNRQVAIKLISAGMFATPDLVKRFKAEAEAAAGLDHPNIVPIYEIGEHEGHHFFSMRLIEGQTLGDSLGKKPMPMMRAAKMLVTVARAVQFAHQRGVLHRDIKSSNILLDHQGEPHLTDFGLAKFMLKESTMTHTNAVLGTPAYMSPEQARGETKEVTTRADVYGLGAVLYEALTGTPPFGGGTSIETIRQVLDQEPRRPSVFNSQVDRDLETICLKCLEKVPDRRYGSAEAVADELERWLRREPIQARPITAFERAWRWCQRRPTVAALAGCVLLLGVVIAIGSPIAIFRINRERQLAENSARAEARQRYAAVEHARALKRSLYVADMKLAQTALDENNLGRAIELVRRHVPGEGMEDLRGFEWRYLWKRCQGDETFTYRGHQNTAACVSFSPDGRTLITGGEDKTIHVLDVRSKKVLATRTMPFSVGSNRERPTWSRDGRWVAMKAGPEVFVLDTAEWKPRPGLSDSAFPVFFPEQRDTLAVRRGDGFEFWDLTTGKLNSAAGALQDIGEPRAISSNNQFAMCTRGGRILVWHLPTWTKIAEFPGTLDRAVWAISSTTNFAAAASWEGDIKIWQLPTGTERTVHRAHASFVLDIDFSPDGNELATSGGDQVARIWDPTTGGRKNALRGHRSEVWGVAYSPDGQELATTSKDMTVKLWTPRHKADEIEVKEAHLPLWFSPDSTRFLTGKIGFRGEPNELHLWDLATMRVMNRFERKFTADPRGFGMSRDGSLMAIGLADGRIEVWHVESQSHRASLNGGANSPAWGIDFSPSNELLATATLFGKTRVWDIANAQQVVEFDESDPVGAAVFSPSGEWLARSDNQYTIHLWNVRTKTDGHKFVGHKWFVMSMAYSPDGKILASASQDNTARLWDVQSGKEIAVLTGHMRGLTCVAFSADGGTLATAGGGVKLWNVATQQEMLTLTEAKGEAMRMQFAPGGQALALSSIVVFDPNAPVLAPMQMFRVPSLKEIQAAERTK